MIKVIIYKLEGDKDPVTILCGGEHVFGRGELLKCDDLRVSRAHGIIKVTPQNATITSTHQNPCFYQAAKSTTITILPKNSPTNISDGDKFALLADKYWFKIKLEGNGTEDETSTKSPSENIQENGDHSSSLLKCDPPQATPLKRAHENEASQPSKKPKRDNNEEHDEEHESDQLATVLNDLKGETPSRSEDNDGEKQEQSETTLKNQTQTETVSDSDENNKNTTPTSSKETKQEEEEKSVDDINKNSAINDSNPNEASGSGTQTKKWRERCRYKLECYRKNAAHLEEFSHPGDSDFESDPEDKRPVCEYGASCYRRNQNHRQKYKHPRDAPNNSKKTQGTRKKKEYYEDSGEESSVDSFVEESFTETSTDYSVDEDSDWEPTTDEIKQLFKKQTRNTRQNKDPDDD